MQIDMNDTTTDNQLVLLVSLEPRAYSEAIGCTIEALRPQLRVKVVQSEILCSEVERLTPEIVLCSEPFCSCGEDFKPYWVEYRPYAEPPAETVRINGKRSGLVNIEIGDFLTLIDRAEESYRST